MEAAMDASGVHHHHYNQQEMCSQTLESMLVCTKAQQEKKPRPPEQALKCPRCDSINTKFCYYNNYSLTQPRYFCKACRRYWTKGGTLRNVPVGGGCRKNRRSSSSSSTSASATSTSSSALSKIRENHHHQSLNMINPLVSGVGQLPYDSTCTDLSLAFARLQSQANGHLGFDHFDHQSNEHFLGNSSNAPSDHLGFLDAIRGGFVGNLGNTPNGYHSMLYGGGNLGNGDMGCVENGGILMGINNASSDHDQEIRNPVFLDHHNQENLVNNGVSREATREVAMAALKQETCHGRSELGENRGSGGVLWGFPWQMGDQGMNVVHEVDSGRSQIGGWNGLGSTTWHGLINSPLM